MSRIAFFAESLNPDHSIEAQMNWALVQSLAECQHEVKVITTYIDENEIPGLHKNVEVIRPFKKWNFLEVMRFLPLLMRYQPDVMHFTQTPFSNKWLNSFRYLATSLKVFNNPVIALSYFNVDPDILSSPLKYHHLTYCDIILVPNSLQMQMVSVVPHLPQNQIIEVFAPTILQSHHPPEASWLTNEFKKIIFVPGPLSSHERVQEIFFAFKECATEHVLVFADGFGSTNSLTKNSIKNTLQMLDLNKNIFILDELSPAQREGLHDAAEWVLLSSLNTAGFHVAYELRRSLHLKKPTILNSSQAIFDNHGWTHLKNCLLIENNRNSYKQLFQNTLREAETKVNIEVELNSLNEQHLVDAPGNRLSRLYLKAQH